MGVDEARQDNATVARRSTAALAGGRVPAAPQRRSTPAVAHRNPAVANGRRRDRQHPGARGTDLDHPERAAPIARRGVDWRTRPSSIEAWRPCCRAASRRRCAPRSGRSPGRARRRRPRGPRPAPASAEPRARGRSDRRGSRSACCGAWPRSRRSRCCGRSRSRPCSRLAPAARTTFSSIMTLPMSLAP